MPLVPKSLNFPISNNLSLVRIAASITLAAFGLVAGAGRAHAQTMTPTLSDTALTCVSNPDGSVTFNVNVTTSDRTPAVGSVKIVDESAETLIGIIDALQPSIRVRDLAPGMHEIRAYYSGSDGVFPYLTEGSVSPIVDYMALAPSTVELETLQDADGSRLVTLKASVTAQGAPVQGRVTFSEGSRVLASQALDGAGQAAFITSALDDGSHRIVAEYKGNAVVATGVSLTHVVDVGGARFHNATLFRRAAQLSRTLSSSD
jgi:hypothetical protein